MNEMLNNQTENERWLSYYSDLLSEKNSLLELKVFAATNYIMNLWKAKNKKVLYERLKTTIRAQKYFAVSSVLVLLWIGILLFSMIQGISVSVVSLGLFVSIVGSVGSLLGITEQLSYTFSNITRHYLQVQHYNTFINLPEIPKHDGEEVSPKGIYEIEFNDVYFHYPNTENEILRGISFKVNSNERLSIVGGNGAGKSTIIKLLCGLYQPDTGTISINRINLNNLSEHQLRDILCVVFQDYCCYNLSLRENIALSQIEKINNDSEIQQALIKGKANMISDNLDVPLGKIEDDGIDISGGQWQRIAIARALFSDSAFVILYRVFIQVIRISPLTGILSLIYNMIEALFPAYITSISAILFETVAKYIDGSADISRVKWLGLSLLIGYGIKQIFQYISSITINAGVYEKVSSNSNGYLFKKCAELPLIKYEDADTMDCKGRATECISREIISQLYMMNVTMIMSAVGVISIIIVLSSYSLLFIPISILSVIPYFVVRIIRGKEFYELKKQQIKKERRKNYLWSLFTGKQSIKEMRVMGFGDYISQKWITARNEVNEETWKLVKKDGLSLLVCDFIRIFGYALCILISSLLVMNKVISVGIFSACIAAFASVQGQTKSFLIELGNIPEKMSYARDYFQFIDRREDDCSCGTKTESIRKIDLHNIIFSYPNTQDHAIKNLNLTINAGEKIDLVGENGSGKTTLTKLLLGIYSPTSGEILLNDNALSQYNREDLLKRLSIISQQFVQYHLTLRENVAMSDVGSISDDDMIEHALEAADFISDESMITLDTILGTEFGGVELSGGKWQKLAIARGVFRNCELIVMDEPTSAIDPISETEILSSFLKIVEDKTAIIVSHRTGLCTLVDKIAVMKDGQIVEFGTHENLLKEDGEYARLFNAQRQWYV